MAHTIIRFGGSKKPTRRVIPQPENDGNHGGGAGSDSVQRPWMIASSTMRGATVVRVFPVRAAIRAVAK